MNQPKTVQDNYCNYSKNFCILWYQLSQTSLRQKPISQSFWKTQLVAQIISFAIFGTIKTRSCFLVKLAGQMFELRFSVSNFRIDQPKVDVKKCLKIAKKITKILEVILIQKFSKMWHGIYGWKPQPNYSHQIIHRILTLTRPLRRNLRMRWFFVVSKVKESIFFKSDLTEPLRFLMRIFREAPN